MCSQLDIERAERSNARDHMTTLVQRAQDTSLANSDDEDLAKCQPLDPEYWENHGPAG
jgi:hypothetical protein